MNPCKKTIEWADFTANPFTGCLHGCDYCYARRMAHRQKGIEQSEYYFLNELYGDPFTPAFHPSKWRKFCDKMIAKMKPTRIFLGSMADLGGDWSWRNSENSYKPMAGATVQDFIKSLSMITRRHTYLILTKNPKGLAGEWPDNCHVGVSADNNKDAARNVRKLLLNVKARVRWASLEPLLELVNPGYLKELDWIVIGGQTGPSAPPVPIENVEEIVVFARREGIPCFVKKNIRDQAPGCWPMEFPK